MRTLKNTFLVWVTFFCFSNIWGQKVVTWNDDGSVTVRGGVERFSTKVSTSDDLAVVMKEMVTMNYGNMFISDNIGGFKNTGYVNISETNTPSSPLKSSVYIAVFAYSPDAQGHKGREIYATYGNEVGKSEKAETVDLPIQTSFKLWKKDTALSTDYKTLLGYTTMMTGNPNCKECFDRSKYNKTKDLGLIVGVEIAGFFATAIATLAAPTAVLAAGDAYVATPGTTVAMDNAVFSNLPAVYNASSAVAGVATAGGAAEVGMLVAPTRADEAFFNDFPVECWKDLTHQPVIIELTVTNATCKSFKIPGPELPDGSDELTPKEVFLQPETKPFEGLIVKQENNSNPVVSADFHTSGSNGLVIQANQAPSSSWRDILDIKLEVWGKMLTRNTTYINSETGIEEPSTSPVINTDYNYGLWVAGEMVSEDFIMLPKETWADYVFDDNYKLPELQTVASFIQENGHLSGIPTLDDIKEGYQQHDINKKLLEKIEELTLYKINQHKLTQESQLKLEAQSKRIEEIKSKLCKN